jgi:hypothetical protein
MLSKEQIADLLIQPGGENSTPAIIVPSAQWGRNFLFRPPLMVNYESLSKNPDTQNTLVDVMAEMLQPPPATIFGSGRERCGDILRTASARLNISSGVLLFTKGKQNSIQESELVRIPSADSNCALFEGMIIEPELIPEVAKYLETKNQKLTTVIALVNSENPKIIEITDELGIEYKYLVDLSTIKNRPLFKERFGNL